MRALYLKRFSNLYIHSQKLLVVEHRMQQHCGDKIGSGCQQYCSAFLHMIAG